MPAIVYLESNLPQPPRQAHKRSLAVRWLSLVSCLQLCAFFLGLLGWILCILSMASVDWREWHVENVKGIASEVILIGIWKVCFGRAPDNDGHTFWHCEEFLERHKTLPKEILITQDLMPLAAIVTTVALGLMAFDLYNIFKPIKHKNFVLTFFCLGGAANLSAGIIVLFPVTWNTYCVLQGKEINFPATFGLPRIPKEQRIGTAIYGGYIAAGLQLLSGSLAVAQKCCSKFRDLHPLAVIKKCCSDFKETHPPEIVVIRTEGTAGKNSSETPCLMRSSTVDLVIREESCTDEKAESSKKMSKSSTENTESILPVPVPVHSIILVTPC